jgi:hypothetical protein
MIDPLYCSLILRATSHLSQQSFLLLFTKFSLGSFKKKNLYNHLFLSGWWVAWVSFHFELNERKVTLTLTLTLTLTQNLLLTDFLFQILTILI